MSTPDKNGWVKGLDGAFRDGRLVHLCVEVQPSDEDDDGVVVDIATWDENDGTWAGYTGDYPDSQVTHWKPCDLPVEYEAEEAAA